jgi:hypothetical protein
VRHIPIIVTLVMGVIFGPAADAQQPSFQFPVPNYLASITQDFGDVNSEYNNKLHTGQDIVAASPGMPVFATSDGTVMLARRWKSCPNWGYILVIDHTLSDGSHVSSVYGHLDATSVVVTEGQRVTGGSMLGQTGKYSCWREHLHFAIHSGPYGAPVSIYPSWLNGYLDPGAFPVAYVRASDFVASHGAGSGAAHLAFSRTDLPTGIGGAIPRAIVVADFNNDGIADMAVANNRGLNGTSSISVFLGRGFGTFGPQTDFALGISSVALAAADFSGDGKLDLVESHLETFSLAISLGVGAGEFGLPTEVSLGSGSDRIIAGDFNRDGKMDVVTDTAFGTVGVLPGRGDGTFGTAIQSAAGQFPTTFAVGDFNGDGIPDLAVANDVSNTVSILLGNGDGSFAPPQLLIGVDGLHDSIITGDFNNDGKIDIAVCNRRSTATATSDQDSVTVWLGNGDGTFQSPQIFHTGPDPFAIVVADLNFDGKLDIATANLSNTVSILPGNGDGTFAAKQDFAVGSVPQALAVGDFNHDGKPDLVVANGGTQTISILTNTSQ